MTREIVGKCLLLELLNKSYMTQTDLSIKTGISKQQINEYIGGTRLMSIYNAKLIAKALACKIDDLYEWKL
ncbi:helix-turn-helix transcriptional regulator [Bacillus sp. Bva_UNVM-123]|uniref:helix-turn-helix domain-containing protein n=1 Tax=Bacillus sp. Bva_UNVM-123 TaxID=2829798 RepID=UPI00391F39F2